MYKKLQKIIKNIKQMFIIFNKNIISKSSYLKENARSHKILILLLNKINKKLFIWFCIQKNQLKCLKIKKMK